MTDFDQYYGTSDPSIAGFPTSEFIRSYTEPEQDRLSLLDLRVRLVPDDPANAEALERVGARPFAPGIMQTLARRESGTDTVRPVAAAEIAARKWDLDATWSTAWVLTRTLESVERAETVEVGGASFVHLFGAHDFTAGLVSFLPELLGPLSAAGAIVSMPVKHSVLAHRIGSGRTATAIGAMIPITRQNFNRQRGAVSPQIYWWRNHRLTPILSAYGPDGVEFYPMPELADILRTVG